MITAWIVLRGEDYEGTDIHCLLPATMKVSEVERWLDEHSERICKVTQCDSVGAELWAEGMCAPMTTVKERRKGISRPAPEPRVSSTVRPDAVFVAGVMPEDWLRMSGDEINAALDAAGVPKLSGPKPPTIR